MMSGRHSSASSNSIISMRSLQRRTIANATAQKKDAETRTTTTTTTSTLQPLKFYWNRPLGASTGTFRLTVCLAAPNAPRQKQRQRQQKQRQAPLSWSLAYTTVDDLCTAILDSVSVVAVELVGPTEAYEALGGLVTRTREESSSSSSSSWNKIRDALVTVLHRCRDDNSSSISSSSTTNWIQSLHFASGVMEQQTASLLASTFKKRRGPSKYVRREVESPKYSVRIHYDTDTMDTDTDTDTAQPASSSSSSSSFLTDTLQHLWVGRDQLHELHLHFEGDGGGRGCSGAYPYKYPYAVNAKDATLLAQILPHLHVVSFHRVIFTCPAAWKLVFASLEMSSLLEHLHLDVSVLHQNLNQNQNQNNNKSNSNSNNHNDSSGATTTSTTTTTTTPDRMATLQAYLDWHVRLNTVRRCLVERDCQVQSVQSKSTRSRRFLAYQQQQQQQQQLSVSMPMPMPDNGAGPLHAVTSAIMTMEAPALATETAAVMDAAVVVLKDWWRATHRPDLPQYQYQYQYCIPETETETETGISAYPPTAATGIDKNGAAAESQRSLGVVGRSDLVTAKGCVKCCKLNQRHNT